MATYTIELPEQAFHTLRLAPVELFKEMRIAAAVEWYAERRISQERAAEMAGLTRYQFIDELRRRKVAAIQIDEDEILNEIYDDE
ncbi:UPF0175 family protein [Ectothiorhodospiraceae bacterium BW-2]|nr:UPF0175 family protein [Ectothiorhodospiraceae bacterium BW-2]